MDWEKNCLVTSWRSCALEKCIGAGGGHGLPPGGAAQKTSAEGVGGVAIGEQGEAHTGNRLAEKEHGSAGGIQRAEGVLVDLCGIVAVDGGGEERVHSEAAADGVAGARERWVIGDPPASGFLIEQLVADPQLTYCLRKGSDPESLGSSQVVHRQDGGPTRAT